ncbi:MAG: CDP-alcohol phosphatidyltransferase family protein [Candidatus Helarchaeota archaeon]
MVLSRLRSVSEKVMKPMANFAIKLGITPNQATLLGFFVSIVAALLIFIYPSWRYILILSSGLFLLAGYFDALDGAIARNSHHITAFGGFLDSVLDRYSDSIIIGCIILVGYPYSVLCIPWIGLVALIGSLLVSYTRARAEAAGGQKMVVGLFERGERMLLIMGVLILQGIPELQYTTNPLYNYTGIGMIILAFMTHITVIQRILYARRILPEIEAQVKAKAFQTVHDTSESLIHEDVPSDKSLKEIPEKTSSLSEKAST